MSLFNAFLTWSGILALDKMRHGRGWYGFRGNITSTTDVSLFIASLRLKRLSKVYERNGIFFIFFFSYNAGVVRLLPLAYRARTKRPVLCTHLGFEEGVLAVACHYPTPVHIISKNVSHY